MQRYFAALTLLLLVAMVWGRSLLMRRKGIRAVHFGKIDKKDFLIPPFALFYFYIVSANAFRLPLPDRQQFFDVGAVSWIGALLCLLGLIVFVLSLISFGRSFRVGIDIDHPDQLITNGIFAFSRNPIYVAFGFILLGQFLVFPNWILLIYMIAAAGLIHRQVLREEKFLRKHYGLAYSQYSARVRRYI